jgi:hypothetical protein
MYSVAAELGHQAAQYNLGKCFKDGIGVQVDEQAAAHWFASAAEVISHRRETPLEEVPAAAQSPRRAFEPATKQEAIFSCCIS